MVDLEEAPGSCAAVLCGGDLVAAAAEIAVRAPAALVAVAVDPDEAACASVYETTLFPASRIIGCAPVDGGLAEGACRVVEAAVLGNLPELTVTGMLNGRFQRMHVRLGPRGIHEVLPD